MCVGRDRVTLEAIEQPGGERLRGRRARKREPDVDPMNLIRVMPAEGEMKKPITTNQRYLRRATNTPSRLRFLSRTMAHKWPGHEANGGPS